MDLTAAYDTAWHRGLRLKLQRHITSEKLTNFIMELLTNRSLVLYTDHGQSSKPYRSKNGVAQGSVLAPLLYNLYTADLPSTLSTRYTLPSTLSTRCGLDRRAENLRRDRESTTNRHGDCYLTHAWVEIEGVNEQNRGLCLSSSQLRGRT